MSSVVLSDVRWKVETGGSWRRLLVLSVTGGVQFTQPARSAEDLAGFVELANKGPIYDQDCAQHGRQPMNYDERAWRRGEQVENVVYAEDGVFVMYAYPDTVKSLLAPTYVLKHCKFSPQ